jgi:hypothetical protein
MVLEIKHLLYEKRYTIEGARKWLETRVRPEPAAKASKAAKALKAAARPAEQVSLFPTPVHGLDEIRKELASILEMLR